MYHNDSCDDFKVLEVGWLGASVLKLCRQSLPTSTAILSHVVC
jgi:hypothetical protein